jgi:oligopeptide/dipeptide ABC transporter ATP-binding protein
MYAGQIVEQAPVSGLFGDPRHPYTRGLLAAMPEDTPQARGTRLGAIPGIVPSLMHQPAGCPFAPRCHHAQEGCTAPPPMRMEGAHAWRCVLMRASPPPAMGAGALPPPSGAPILLAEGLRRQYSVGRGLFRSGQMLHAVDGVASAAREA